MRHKRKHPYISHSYSSSTRTSAKSTPKHHVSTSTSPITLDPSYLSHISGRKSALGPELQRRSSKILPGQRPLSKRFLSSKARFIALPSIIDSLASPPPQGKILPIATKCLMDVNALDLWSLQISFLWFQ